jgi:hypothetical protein
MMFRQPVPGFKTPNPSLVYSLVTGDPAGGGYFPMNAIRWRTPPRDIAAMVTESARDRFCAELFHFGEKSRRFSADLYLLSEGQYTLTLSSPVKDAELLRRPLKVTGTVTRIDLELPPQQPIRVCVMN